MRSEMYAGPLHAYVPSGRVWEYTPMDLHCMCACILSETCACAQVDELTATIGAAREECIAEGNALDEPLEVRAVVLGQPRCCLHDLPYFCGYTGAGVCESRRTLALRPFNPSC